MKPKKCGYPRYVLSLLTLMLLHNHGKATFDRPVRGLVTQAQYDFIIEAANQCHGINHQTDGSVKAMTDLTCKEAFRAIDELKLNTGCPVWSDAKCRRISPGDDFFECSVKVPNPCGVFPQKPQTIFDCAPALTEGPEEDRPPSVSAASRRADKGKGKAPAQGRAKTRSRRTDSGSGSSRANPFPTRGSSQAPGFSYTGGSSYAGGAPYIGGSSYPGGSAPAGYSLPRTPQYTTHPDPTEAPNFNVHDYFRNNPSLESIFGTSRPANLPPNPPPGHITDESFSVDEMLGADPSGGQNLPYNFPQLPLSPQHRSRSPLTIPPGYIQDESFSVDEYMNQGDPARSPTAIPAGLIRDESFGIEAYMNDEDFESSSLPGSPLGAANEGGAEDTPAWRCPEPGCGSILRNKISISVHKWKHTAIRRGYTTCRKCNQVFGSLPTYDTHIKEHFKKDGVWVLTCGVCGEKFKDERSIRQHELKYNHGSIPQLPTCRECEQFFRSEKDLKTHEKIHKAFSLAKCKCRSCKEVFKSGKELKFHMNAKHGPGGPSQPDPNRPLVCDSCGETLADPKYRAMHKRAHTGETSCHVCGAYFGFMKNKTKHLKQKHPDEYDDQNEDR